MSAPAKLAMVIGLLAGLVLGLYSGWEASPPGGEDTTPASLRAHYKAEYAIMVAEIFAADRDAAGAETRLSLLGPPAAVLPEAFATALALGRPGRDLDRLGDLAGALAVEIPPRGGAPP